MISYNKNILKALNRFEKQGEEGKSSFFLENDSEKIL